MDGRQTPDGRPNLMPNGWAPGLWMQDSPRASSETHRFRRRAAQPRRPKHCAIKEAMLRTFVDPLVASGQLVSRDAVNIDIRRVCLPY